MTDPGTHHIGSWRFDPAGARLIGPEGEHRLEDRAARTLDMLCRARGEVVSQADMLEEIWHGRAVSAGSVAVVIRDLRRALGDDARHPRYIATVPKRGYRLAPAPDAGPPPARPAEAAPPQAAPRRALRPVVLAGSVLAACAMLVAAALPWHAARPLALTVEPVRNDTGSAAFEPLSRALSRLVVTHLAGNSAMSVIEGGATHVPTAAPALILRASLILWNGEPTLSLTETRATSGEVVWARMAEGPAPALPGNTVKALQELGGRPSV